MAVLSKSIMAGGHTRHFGPLQGASSYPAFVARNVLKIKHILCLVLDFDSLVGRHVNDRFLV